MTHTDCADVTKGHTKGALCGTWVLMTALCFHLTALMVPADVWHCCMPLMLQIDSGLARAAVLHMVFVTGLL